MRERVLKYMEDFGSITTLNAFIDLGCTRLSEYIRQIRKTHGVKDEWETTINRYNEPVRYKRYWLEDDVSLRNNKEEE